MKKYNVKIQLLTGSWFENGEKEVAREIEVHTNSMNYVTKKMFDNFSEIDIHTNKVRIIDIK